ncbi:hypothetical protein ACWB3A_18920, partial [Acinetobacter baumannii]
RIEQIYRIRSSSYPSCHLNSVQMSRVLSFKSLCNKAVGRDKKSGKLVCLGGNQSNKVCYALYNDSDFQEFRWYGRTTQPASKRYNLPQLSGVTAIRVTEA